MLVEVVAVFYCVVNRLGYRDHDISINIIIEAEFFLGVVYEALHHPDVFG